MKSFIKVAVRIRPPIPKEIKDKEYKKCLAHKNNSEGAGPQGADSKIYISLSGKPIIINA